MATDNKIEVTLTANGVRLNEELKKVTAGMAGMEAAGKSAKANMGSTFGPMEAAITKLTGAFAALGATSYLKDSALMASRYETLGVVMGVVGRNAGYTSTEMENFSQGLQKNGIAMLESRDVLTKMAQAHIDLSKSTELSRIAQDAAVIGNLNSSEAFDKMIYGIQSGQVDVLRTIGINVNFEDSYKKLSAQLGKTSKDLTEQEKMQARTNVVMEAGTGIAGSYEAAMGTAGKMLNSLTRYLNNIKVLMGEAFGPAMTVLVGDFTEASKGVESSLKNNKVAIQEWGNSFRGVIVAIKAEMLRMAMLIDKVGGTLTSAGMLLTGPGKALGIDSSSARFDAFAQANIELEARYNASDAALQKLADDEIAYENQQAQLAAAINLTADAVKKKFTIENASGPSKAELAKQERELAKEKKDQLKEEEAALKHLADIREYQGTVARESTNIIIEAEAEIEQAMMTESERSVDAINRKYDALDRLIVKQVEAGNHDQAWADSAHATMGVRMQEDLTKLTEKGEDSAKKLNDAFSGWANNMSKDLNDIMWGADLTFGSMLESFAKMITQMVLQIQVVEPLIKSMTTGSGGGIGGFLTSIGTSLIGGLAGGTGVAASVGDYTLPSTMDLSKISFNAKGGVFQSPSLSAYSNSVVSKPTRFAFAHGAGLMGEAGPEAIIPLKRGSNGALGIAGTGSNVTVNVINNANGTQASTRETKDSGGNRMIEVFIDQVKGAIAGDITRGDGAVPSAMASTYGLNRVAGAY